MIFETLPESGISTLGSINAMINRNFAQLANSGSADASLYVLGANIARFLKKLKDYHSNRTYAKAPTICFIGDSLLNTTWVESFATYLNTQFGLPTTNVVKYNYGGQSIAQMLPQVLDGIVYPNWDLVCFCEYEGNGTNDKYLHEIENVIQLLRERTSSDIIINTWGCTKSDLQTFISNPTTISTNTAFQIFNWYRDVAKTYNCELVDVNWKLITYALNGGNLDTIYADDIHLTTDGAMTIFYPEFVKHFQTPIWIENTNITYPLRDKEALIFASEQLRFKSLIKGNIVFNNESNWSLSDNFVNSSTADDNVIIDVANSIGFEVKYLSTTGILKIQVSFDNGSTWINPSDITFNSLPLSYCTPGYTSGISPLGKHITIKNNILANGTLESGNYYQKVTNVSGTNYTITLYNPSNVSLGTYLLGQTALDITDFNIPLTFNGENNFDLVNYTPILNATQYFKVKSNWIDQIDLSSGNTAKVFGFARSDYKVRLTLVSGECKILGINTLK